MPDERLDDALRDLGSAIAFPPTPALGPEIEERLAGPFPRRALRWRPALLAAVIATLLLAATVAAVVFGLAGLRITFTDALPSRSIESSPLAARLTLGESVTLQEAVERATVGVAWPHALGEPDETYVSTDGEIVSHIYAADDDLPELADAGIGLLVMQIDGRVDPEGIEKLVLQIGASITEVSVSGARGYWIEGRRHVLRYEDPSGGEGQVMSRLVGDVLVWERGGVLHRIESGLGLDATLRIAESFAGR